MAEDICKKIVLVGDKCGKTCLRYRFCFHSFPDYMPEFESEYNAKIEVDEKPFLLTLTDTVSTSEYDRLRPLFYSESDAFIVCFSLENRTSFQNVRTKWIPEIQQHCPGLPFVIVGTKSDLWLGPDTETIIETSRGLSDGQKLARKLGAYTYNECSAKTGHGVREAFESAVRASMLRKKKKRLRDSCITS